MGGGAPPLEDDAWQAQDDESNQKGFHKFSRRTARWLGNILEILWNSGHRPLTKSCFQAVMFSRQYARYPPDHISCSTAVLGCVGCTQGKCCELFLGCTNAMEDLFHFFVCLEEWLVWFVCLWRCGFLFGCIAKPKTAQEILWITNITLWPWLGFPPEKWQKNVYCAIHLDVGFFLFSFIPCKVRNQRWAKSSISGTSQNRQLTVGWLDAFAPFAADFAFGVHLFSKDVALSIFFDAEGQDF